NGCETKDELLIITSASPEISLTDSLFINCQTNTVQLEGKIEYAASSFWTGPNEFYSMDLNAEVSVAGTYTLTAVSESGCETQSEVVVAEGITPMVFLGDSLFILCNAPSVRLSGKTEYSARRFWTGPKNFYSTQIDAEVREPGIYTLTAVSDKGCETKGEIVVAHGPPPMVFLEDTIYMPCNSSSVRLRGKTEYSVRRYWNGPDGFYSKQIDAEISTLGVYTLTAISAKGCEVSGEVIVAIDNREVSVSAGEDQVLSCANPLVQLAGATEGATSFEWGGPGGFESSSLSPEVGIAGSYVLTAVSSSGCSRTDTVWVQEGKKTATVNAGPDKELNCANTQVQLSGTVSEGAEISWSGPGSFVSNELEITVSQAGTYILYAMDVEGCEGWDTVEVRENIIIPEAFAGPDIRLDCQSGMGILEAYAPGDVSFNWTGPNGFIAIEPTIEVNTAGAYILTVTSDNQCTATDTVEVGPCELACEGMKITEVILLHARTGRDWMILGENDTLVTTALPDEISIEALTENCLFQVKSVGFSLTGEQEFERVDNAAPWSLVGDSEGSFLSWDYQPGTYELTITPYSERLGEGVAGIPYTLKLTILAPTPTPEGSFAMRINCGATRESSFGGYIFSEDNFYTGRTETANNPLIYDIEGTSFDQLYRLSRSSVQSEGEIVYQIPVPNATYAVHLHFAETHWDATNGEAAEDTSRIFDVYMESSKVISSLNLLNTYGTMTAYAFQYKAAVRDGILEIRLAASEDRPILSGIEILSLDLEDQALIYSPDYARERIADGSTSLELGIIPNPIRDQGILSISGQETGPLQLRVVDQGGRVWLSKQLLKEAYTQQTEIEAERLPKGLYVVVVNGKNIATSKMFIVN
ncbi:MAG: malectin domain-containing carbohydrate-binding protein, partial [Bacteroidota bacterium]